MTLTIARIKFDVNEIRIVETAPLNKRYIEIGVDVMLNAIGIKRGVNGWPLPCLDLDVLHKRNMAAQRRLKRRRE